MKAVLATVALMLLGFSTGAAAAADPCQPQCQQTRQEQISNCGGASCVETAQTVRSNCRRALNSCLKGCRPLAQGAPGRCALVRDCAERCREALGDHTECNRRYESKLRKLCGRKCVRSAVTVKSCVKEFKHADVVCTTTSTSSTSSTTSTSTSLTTTSSSEPVAGASTTSSTIAAISTPTEPATAGLDCKSCILTLASPCYLACADNCNGDADAIGVCHSGCRDAQCDRLEEACGEECANCVATTTSTSRTTTTVTTTSTSTIDPNATTTSTTLVIP